MALMSKNGKLCVGCGRVIYCSDRYCSGYCRGVRNKKPDKIIIGAKKKKKKKAFKREQKEIKYLLNIINNEPFYDSNGLIRDAFIYKNKNEKKIKKGRCLKLTSDFYKTREWQELRYKVLKKYKRTCMLCGDNKSIVHVDHIKPKSKYPHLALDFNNLQVLCEQCNLGKSNKDETDWREQNNVVDFCSIKKINDKKIQNQYTNGLPNERKL